jgi:PhnB protein
MMRLNPYLTFNGDAREAMEFYRSVLGGQLQINTFSEYGAPDGTDPDGVMHAYLETDEGFVLMASDNAPGRPDVSGDNVSISLSGATEDGDKLRGYFEGLAQGGQVTMPLEKQVWGDEFGMLVDKFGVPWMVDFGDPTAE